MAVINATDINNEGLQATGVSFESLNVTEISVGDKVIGIVSVPVKGQEGIAPPFYKGESAYSIAVKHGFAGTEQEWIESLKRPAIEAAESVLIVENQISINEQGRVQAENERETSESIRVSNENNRVTAEQERVEAESLRATAESSRELAESSRELAESLRVEAELLRQTSIQEAISNAENAMNLVLANVVQLELRDDMCLWMITPDTYQGVTFKIESGDLIAVIQ